MSAPDDAPKSALKLPLAQGAVTHVAQFSLWPSFRQSPVTAKSTASMLIFPCLRNGSSATSTTRAAHTEALDWKSSVAFERIPASHEAVTGTKPRQVQYE